MSKYDDIINLPHHVSKTHKPMPLISRAAQFAPFSAFTGYEDSIAEAARLTTPEQIIPQEEADKLSRRFAFAVEHLTENNELKFTYFIPDKTKSGGEYVTIVGIIRKYDEFAKTITLENGKTLHIENILSINGKTIDDAFE